jgi:hypothetical protein
MVPELEELEQNLQEVRKGLLQLASVILALCGILFAEIIVFRWRSNFPDGGLVALASSVAIAYTYHLWFLTQLSLRAWRKKAEHFFGQGMGWAFLEIDSALSRRNLLILFFPSFSLFCNTVNCFLKSPLSAYTSGVVGLLCLTEALVLARHLGKA